MPTDAVRPTMLSELITELADVLSIQGDIPVCAQGFNFQTAKVCVSVEPDYYDGGCLMPLGDAQIHCQHWVRSRNQPWLYICRIQADEPTSRQGQKTR